MATNLAVGITIGATLGAAYNRVFKDAKTRLKELGDAHKQTNTELAAAGALLKYKRKLDDVRAEHAKVGTSADKMLADAKKAYAGAEKAAKKYGIEVGNVTERQGTLQRKLEGIERTRKRLQRKESAAADLGAIRARLLGVAGVGYGIARLTGEAMEREEQGQYLRTVINAPDKDAAVGRALEFAREFSRQSLASDQEVIEIQYALHSASFDEAEAEAAVSRVHKLAKVTRGSAGQVGEVFATTINNMGESMTGTIEQKMDRVANVLAKTQFKFQIRDFGQLGEGLKYASSSAIAAKVPLEQTAAVIGQLNSAGLQGTTAGTSFAAMLRTLGGASDDFGFKIARTADGEMDLIRTLENLRASMNTDVARERVGGAVEASGGRLSAADVVAQEIQDSFGEEGARGINLLLGQLDQLKAAHAEVQAAGESNMVNEEYGRFLEGGAAQWKMLGQNVKQVGEIFANTLLPAINSVLGPVSQVAAWVSESIERYPWVGRLIGGLALGLGLVTVGFAGWAGAIWLANVALLANPIGLVVAAIIGGAAIIYSLWEPITEKVGELWDKIKSLGEVLKDIGEAMKTSLIGKAVRKLFGMEVDEDEATPGRPAKPAVRSRGYRSAGDAPPDAGDAPPDAGAGIHKPRGRGSLGRTFAAVVIAAPIAVAAAPAPAPASPVAGTAATAPVAGTAATAPVAGTAATPPVAGTAATAPVAGTAATAPVAGTAATPPVAGTAATAPVAGTAATPPVAGTAATAPVAGTAATAPVAGTAATPPVAGTAATPPVAGTAATAPVAGTAATAPVAGTAATPPVAGTAATPPVAGTAATAPVAGTAATAPVAGTAATPPVAGTAATPPVAGTAATPPVAGTAATPPVAGTAATPPVAGTAATPPVAGTAATPPVAGTAATAPVAGTAATAPVAGTAATPPVAGTAATPPVAGTAATPPVAGTAATPPVAGTAATPPVAGTAATPPVAGTAATPPVAGTAATAPVAGTAATAPVAGTAATPPVAGTAATPPVAGTAATPPVAGTAATPPVAPVAGDGAAASSSVLDVAALQARMAGINKSLQAARAAIPAPGAPPAPGDGLDIDALRTDVDALAEFFQAPPPALTTVAPPPVTAAPVAPEQVTAPPRETTLVFHQTFNFQGPASEVADEVARQMEMAMRRAAVEAGLGENDDVS